jgi:hypothetical protein
VERTPQKLTAFGRSEFITKYFVAIKTSGLHPNVKAFLDFTFRVIEEGKPHEIAAAYLRKRRFNSRYVYGYLEKIFRKTFPKLI